MLLPKLRWKQPLFKLIFILIAQPVNASDCKNFIAASEVPAAIAGAPNVGSKSCGAKDTCICFDGVDWAVAVFDREKLVLSNDKVKADERRSALEKSKAQREIAKQACSVLFKKIEDETATGAEVRSALKCLML